MFEPTLLSAMTDGSCAAAKLSGKAAAAASLPHSHSQRVPLIELRANLLDCDAVSAAGAVHSAVTALAALLPSSLLLLLLL